MITKNKNSIHYRYLLGQIDKIDLQIKQLQTRKQALCDEANALKLTPEDVKDLKAEYEETKRQRTENDLII